MVMACKCKWKNLFIENGNLSLKPPEDRGPTTLLKERKKKNPRPLRYRLCIKKMIKKTRGGLGSTLGRKRKCKAKKTAGLVARSSYMGLVSLRGQWHLEMGLDGPAHIPARVVQAARPTSRTQSFRSMALPELETEHGSQEN